MEPCLRHHQIRECPTLELTPADVQQQQTGLWALAGVALD